jgi:predicted secreted protein with PEFG-CTERM motif
MVKVILRLVFTTIFTIVIAMVIPNVIPAYAANNPYLACPDCSNNSTAKQISGIDIVQGAGSTSISGCMHTNNCYSPTPSTVSPGATVIWTNRDTVSHTITSGKVRENNTGSLFDSGLIKSGSTFQFTFSNPGTFDYFCTVHPWMAGQVIVGNVGTTTRQAQFTLNTDKSSYKPGDLVMITGTLSGASNDFIGLEIKDSNGNLILVRTIQTDSKGNFTLPIKIPGSATSGNFEISVNANVNGHLETSTKTFMQTVPEFGPLAGVVLIISILSILVFSRKIRFFTN